MNKEVVLKWAELLETTKVKQIRDLYEKDGSFCAVGLGASVLAGYNRDPNPNVCTGYCDALESVGVPDRLINQAIKMNFTNSFKDIADMLRESVAND